MSLAVAGGLGLPGMSRCEPVPRGDSSRLPGCVMGCEWGVNTAETRGGLVRVVSDGHLDTGLESISI